MNAPRLLRSCVALSILSTSLSADPRCGDVNADGLIDPADAIAIQRHVTGVLPLTANRQTRADVDGQMGITFQDTVWLLNFIGGNPGFEPQCPPLVTAKIYAATYSPSTITVVDGPTRAILETLSTASDPIALAADPTRDRVYALFFDQTLGVIDTVTDDITSIQSMPGLVGAMEVTCDGSALVGVSMSATGAGLMVIDLPSLTLRHQVDLGAGLWGSGFMSTSRDSKLAWLSDPTGNRVLQVDLLGGLPDGSVSVGRVPMGVDLSEDGQRLFVANHSSHELSIIDVASLTEISRTMSAVLPVGVLAHSNGNAFLAGTFTPQVFEHEGTGGLQLQDLGLSVHAYLLRELRDGTLATVTLVSPTLHLVDPVTGLEEVVALPGPTTDLCGISRPFVPLPISDQKRGASALGGQDLASRP